jgi:hypothetical protein
MCSYPQAGLRHFRFMLEGLAEIAATLAARGIPLVVRWGSPPEVALGLAGDTGGRICDRAFLPPLVAWRAQIAREMPCAVWQVEIEPVVPADAASVRMEVAARALRPRLNRLLPEHLSSENLAALPETVTIPIQVEPPLAGVSLANPDKPLEAHATAPLHLYDLDALEAVATHDPYWNCRHAAGSRDGIDAQPLRMYWGRKILEWSPTPEEALPRCLDLNHRYFLDGLAPTSYANISWIFGRHDRPWLERPVFGTMRHMNAAGLERKCDMPAYMSRIGRLAAG